jgi:site-specific DNA-methyltransferase (cytosine-N4-specific)
MAVQIPFDYSTYHTVAETPQDIIFNLDAFKEKNYLTHNFHPYPAKFVPHIPRLVIEALTKKGEQVLDPFCGSGTTLVEANILGRRAVGFDLNPLSGLISRVKTTALNNEQLLLVENLLYEVENKLLLGINEKSLASYSVDIPEFQNRDHWFQPHVQLELAFLKNSIMQVSDEVCRDFLKVAFSAIIVKVSNQDSDTRWVAVEKRVPLGETVRVFLLKTRDMVTRIKEFRALNPSCSEVFIQSITEPLPLEHESVDLIVTSPPYLNSFDYYLYHKLRFFWLGMNHYSVQAEEIGSRHRHCDKGEGIETYTSSMLTAIRALLPILKPEKFLCVVIGDSILKGNLINMKDTYSLLGKEAGFALTHSFSYDQRKYTSAFTRNLKKMFKQSHILFFRKDN